MQWFLFEERFLFCSVTSSMKCGNFNCWFHFLQLEGEQWHTAPRIQPELQIPPLYTMDLHLLLEFFRGNSHLVDCHSLSFSLLLQGSHTQAWCEETTHPYGWATTKPHGPSSGLNLAGVTCPGVLPKHQPQAPGTATPSMTFISDAELPSSSPGLKRGKRWSQLKSWTSSKYFLVF